MLGLKSTEINNKLNNTNGDYYQDSSTATNTTNVNGIISAASISKCCPNNFTINDLINENSRNLTICCNDEENSEKLNHQQYVLTVVHVDKEAPSSDK